MCKYISREMKTNVILWGTLFASSQKLARLHVIDSTAFFAYKLCDLH